MMGSPTAAQIMAAILTALRTLSVERSAPVTEAALAAHLDLPVKAVRYHLVSMERLGMVRRSGGRGRDAVWLLPDPRS